MKLKRIIKQEYGKVKFWAEAEKENVTASLVDGDFSDEMEIRITVNNDRFSVCGHRVIMDKFTFEQFTDKVFTHVERHESLKRIKIETR